MACFTDALRGDGLDRVHSALEGFDVDAMRLDRARRRFSGSPPAYTSNPSGTTTRSESPMPLSEEQRRRDRRLVELRLASLPYEQFSAQTSEELERLWDADPRMRGIRLPGGSSGGTHDKMARENVKRRWMDQGIWNKWNDIYTAGRWKHEEPLEVESESEADSETESPLRPFSLGMSLKPPRQKPRRPKSDEEKRPIAERRAEREREASRSYYQFVYQISKERELIEDESRSEEGASIAEVNSKAYEKVKETWIKRGIWNKKWGILPRVSWKHEEPLEEETADGPVPVSVNLLGHAQRLISHEAVQAHPSRIFGSLSPVEPNHPQEPGIMNASQQGPSVNIDSIGLENGDAVYTPSASNSPHTRIDGQVLRPVIGQAPRRSNRKPSQKVQPVVDECLGPVHPSKISKAVRKTQLGPQRPNVSKRVSFGGLPLPSDVSTGETQPSLVHVTPRRSKRI
jgi:hypothetical protein